MRMDDIEVGDLVLVRYATEKTVYCRPYCWNKRAASWPAVVVWAPRRVIEKLARGRLVIEEFEWTWDYENRPKGCSLTAWQMGDKKSAVRRTNKREISARSVRPCRHNSSEDRVAVGAKPLS